MKEVLVTNDYGVFKTLQGNRSVEPSRVQKIVSSIQSVGYVTNPIIVNEKMEVIDGQGRLKALEELGFPVEYVIHEGAGVKECVAMNLFQTNWKLIDYVRSYADCGKQDYIYLQSLINEYRSIPIRTVISVCVGKKRYSPETARSVLRTENGDIVQGNFKIRRSKGAIIGALDYINRFSKFKVSQREVFCNILTFLYFCEDVDEEAFYEKMEMRGNNIRSYSNTAECIEAVEEVLNWKARTKTYLRELFDKYRTENVVFAGRMPSSLEKENSADDTD